MESIVLVRKNFTHWNEYSNKAWVFVQNNFNHNWKQGINDWSEKNHIIWSGPIKEWGYVRGTARFERSWTDPNFIVYYQLGTQIGSYQPLLGYLNPSRGWDTSIERAGMLHKYLWPG